MGLCKKKPTEPKKVHKIDCRFDYPKAICPNTHLAIKHSSVGKGKDTIHHYRLELVPGRNNSWLNSHFRPVFESWRANVDFQLIIDVGKVTGYMTKYVTKTGTRVTQHVASMMKKILSATIEGNEMVVMALKRTMSKLLGERMLSMQETCHLIMSKPLVSCSHRFVWINLLNNSNKVDMNSKTESDKAFIYTVVDSYGIQMDPKNWFDKNQYHTVQPKLEKMSL